MRRRERATAVGAGLLAAAYNVAVNRVLPPATHVPANLAFAAGLCGLGHAAAHASRSDLGLGLAEARSGLRVGVRSSLVSAGLVAAALAAPTTRRFFVDERVLRGSPAEAAYEVCVRIPLATALPEEMVFRGVLLGVLSRSHPAATSIAWTSTLFGLWHVLPMLDTLRSNPLGDVVPNSRLAHAATVGAATLATGAAGAVFALLRNRSGSVLAPFLAHTTINATAYVGGRMTGRRKRVVHSASHGHLAVPQSDGEQALVPMLSDGR